MSKINWSFKKISDFLKDYGFVLGHIEGSHHYYNGVIKGEQKTVQIILSRKERECQTGKTIKIVIKHSGIPKQYFEEWAKNKKIHKEIIG